jgi:hypothetical protein
MTKPVKVFFDIAVNSKPGMRNAFASWRAGKKIGQEETIAEKKKSLQALINL